MSRFLLPLLLVLSTSAHAALGPNTPPSGWVGTVEDWQHKVWNPAADVAKAAGKLKKNTNVACLRALLLRFIASSEEVFSRAVHGGQEKGEAMVAKGKGAQFSRELSQYRDENCDNPNDPNGRGGDPVATLEAFVQYVGSRAEWSDLLGTHAGGRDEFEKQVTDYLREAAKRQEASRSGVVDTLKGAAGLGVGLEAVKQGATAVPGAVLVTPHPCDVNPKAPFCPRPDGT